MLIKTALPVVLLILSYTTACLKGEFQELLVIWDFSNTNISFLLMSFLWWNFFQYIFYFRERSNDLFFCIRKERVFVCNFSVCNIIWYVTYNLAEYSCMYTMRSVVWTSKKLCSCRMCVCKNANNIEKMWFRHAEHCNNICICSYSVFYSM